MAVARGLRRVRAGVILTLAAGLVIAGCAQEAPTTEPNDGANGDESSEGEDGDEITLRMYWWGSDLRHRITEEAIAAYEAENQGVTIQAEYADWSAYWDRLATMTAGGDMPDIVQMDLQFLSEYAARGALADLEDLPIDFSEWDEATVDNGRTPDGLFAAVAGINAQVALLNPELFAEAGMDLPDDRTWNWDDYHDIAQQISDSGAGYGTSPIISDHAVEAWLNQEGLSLFTDDGGLGFEPADLAEYYTYIEDLTSSGAAPDPATQADDVTAPLDQSLFATGQSAMSFWWSNQLAALEDALGSDVEVALRPSSNTGGSPSGTYYKASMFFSIAETSPHQEEAARFLDFLLNSEEAGQIVLAERGVAPNLRVRESMLGDLTEADARISEFIDEISETVDAPPPIPPEGGSTAQEVLQRIGLEVVFGQSSPAEAAESAHAELAGNLG